MNMGSKQIDLDGESLKNVYSTLVNLIDGTVYQTTTSDKDVSFTITMDETKFLEECGIKINYGYDHLEIDDFAVCEDFDIQYIDNAINEDIGKQLLLNTPQVDWNDYMSIKIFLDQIEGTINDKLVRNSYLYENKILVMVDLRLENDNKESYLLNDIIMSVEIYQL